MNFRKLRLINPVLQSKQRGTSLAWNKNAVFLDLFSLPFCHLPQRWKKGQEMKSVAINAQTPPSAPDLPSA
jgi:hypothetical protein